MSPILADTLLLFFPASFLLGLALWRVVRQLDAEERERAATRARIAPRVRELCA